MIEPKVQVNAKTFQPPLIALNETMVKVLTSRGQAYFPDPEYAAADLALLLRYSSTIFRLLCFLNADIRRQNDTDWHVEYGVTAMALVRGMIDSLYNVTMILQDPSVYARRYHKSGIQRALKDLDEDRTRYSGQTEWDEYVKSRQKHLDEAIRKSKLTPAEMGVEEKWLTMGKYLSQRHPGGLLDDHQQFLKTFTYMGWRQYSALSHGAYEAFVGVMGPMPLGAYFLKDHFLHEVRPKVEESYEYFISGHIGRAAAVLLCTITEVQLKCRIPDHRINERICEIWRALHPVLEAKELYTERYSQLMQDAGIEPKL